MSTSTLDEELGLLFKLADDSQYLKAEKMWEEMRGRIGVDVQDIPDHHGEQKRLSEILQRACEVQAALKIEDISINDNNSDQPWTLGAEYWGIKTHYKVENGKIRVRMEGGLDDLPLFEQCAVIHEVDLFKEWVPFCSDSHLVEKLGHAELFLYLCVSPLFVSRDTCLHAYGADCLYESGQIILIGRSIDHVDGVSRGDTPESIIEEASSANGTIIGMDASHTVRCATNIVEEHSCPWKKESWQHKRMDVTEFTAIFKPTHEKAASAVIVGIVNFVIKKMAGLALYFFQKRVSEVARTTDSSTSAKICENPNFYSEWLLPKVRQYYDYRGWELGEIPSLVAIESSSRNKALDTKPPIDEALADHRDQQGAPGAPFPSRV